mmetsp:Transcript_3562/g.4761  ORF Transcript_3562/g.4761 Transcript_3562/m.4761 type:complete len:80 (+) Transcript_3562:425-664(+)
MLDLLFIFFALLFKFRYFPLQFQVRFSTHMSAILSLTSLLFTIVVVTTGLLLSFQIQVANLVDFGQSKVEHICSFSPAE